MVHAVFTPHTVQIGCGLVLGDALEGGECPGAGLSVLDDRLGIGLAERHPRRREVEGRGFPRRVDIGRLELGKLVHPGPHIGAVGVEFPALEHWVEDAEIGRCIGPVGSWPL